MCLGEQSRVVDIVETRYPDGSTQQLVCVYVCGVYHKALENGEAADGAGALRTSDTNR
jgi:hypothetical protein